MLNIQRIHHVALIVSDYEKSKKFYTEIVGCKIIQETFRNDRNSYKLDLAINDKYQIELFTFPNSLPRTSFPEAQGLRHLAFAVKDVEASIVWLRSKNIVVEDYRIDEFTYKKFTFFFDPDNQPLELYEI